MRIEMCKTRSLFVDVLSGSTVSKAQRGRAQWRLLSSDAQGAKVASFLPKVEAWAWFLWKTASCRQHRSCFVHIFIDSTGDFVKCV